MTDTYKTNITVKAQLSGGDAEFFNYVIELNKQNGRTIQDLVEFIFNIGVTFLKGSFTGSVLVQKNFSNILQESMLPLNKTTDSRKIKNNKLQKKCKIDKIIYNNKDVAFTIMKNNEIHFKNKNRWDKIKFEYRRKSIPFIKNICGG